ncbi:MAG TPA: SWIM zinc finger family protein, partial [Labilithrix sp.]|nr:SWIM zinc finger family protein [Labilithrix sp.]
MFDNQGVERIFRTYEPTNLSRGKTYARQGRVTNLQRDSDGWTAVVTGTQRYRVLLRSDDGGRRFAECTCPAYERADQCKHIAALAWTLSGESHSRFVTTKAPAGGRGGPQAASVSAARTESPGPSPE